MRRAARFGEASSGARHWRWIDESITSGEGFCWRRFGCGELFGVSVAHAQATGCAEASSQTIARPQGATPDSIVKISLQQTCGSNLVPTKCSGTFVPTSDMSIQAKCEALANAVRLSAQCAHPIDGVDAGFTISADNCGAAPTGAAVFTVKGPCPAANSFQSLSLGIANNPNAFSEETDGGAPLPDYEAEIITPGCTGAALPPGGAAAAALAPAAAPTLLTSEFALSGTAMGIPIVSGVTPMISAFVDRSANGGQITEFDVPTTPGMSVQTIVTQLNQKLQANGVSCSLKNTSLGVPFAVICSQPTSGKPFGFGILTSDIGVGWGNMAIAPPIVPPTPALPAWALLLLACGLGGAGCLWILRSRAAGGAKIA